MALLESQLEFARTALRKGLRRSEEVQWCGLAPRLACCTDHDVGEVVVKGYERIGTDRFKLSGKLGEVLVGGTWSPIHIASVLVTLLLFIGDAEGGEAEQFPIAVVIVEETDARVP